MASHISTDVSPSNIRQNAVASFKRSTTSVASFESLFAFARCARTFEFNMAKKRVERTGYANRSVGSSRGDLSNRSETFDLPFFGLPAVL